tara:strand:+ start:1017 stop:1862 length:846 start_codon:yes stop_codon:yes gene_type:complete
MKYIKIKSYAKLNLALNITGKKKNLHKIESLVTFANHHDEIFVKVINSKKHKISFYGRFSKNIKYRNTISSLLNILEKKKLLQNIKFDIRIKKKIPIKSGLGGGSINAACILKFLIQKKFVNLTKNEIIDISKLVGSDVILGFNFTNLIFNSKGQLKFFKNCRKFYILICKPNFGCSTKKMYSKIKIFNKPKLNNPKKNMFDLDYLKKMHNSFETIAYSNYPKLRNINLFLHNSTNPDFVRMTGSGSAIVAYFQSKEKCDKAKKLFNKKYKNYWCIASKTI